MSLVQELAPQIRAEVEKAKSILLHFHPSPDPDSVGGALAMMHVLKGMGKNVTVMKGDSDVPPEFSFFPGIDQVLMKNWHEITPSEYDLFIAQDSSGVGMITRMVGVEFPLTQKVIIIDHHLSNTKFGHINFVDTEYAAVCEMLFHLFKEWQVTITPEIAHCLLIGIYTDTGGLRYDSTTPRTVETFAALAKIYPKYTKSLFVLGNSRNKASFMFEGLALSHVTEYPGGLTVSAVAYTDLEQHQIKENDTSSGDTSNTIKSVIGWEIGASCIEIAPGKTKMSFRTRNPEKYDLSIIAGKLGGGGHKAAAGAFIEKPLPEAIQTLVDAFNMYRTERGL